MDSLNRCLYPINWCSYLRQVFTVALPFQISRTTNFYVTLKIIYVLFIKVLFSAFRALKYDDVYVTTNVTEA